VGRIRTVSGGTCGTGGCVYQHDPFGRRYSKTVGGVLTMYLPDNFDQEVAEYAGVTGAPMRKLLYGRYDTAPVGF